MASRGKVKRSRDKKIFRKAADKVKAININPKVARGGIRL